MSIEKEMVRIACKALDDKKAKDIKIIDIHEVSVIADYFVIASASNQNQVQAMVMRKTDFSTILRGFGETARFLMRKNFLVRMSKICYISLL